MRLRQGVEADFGVTNSLGIRADFESGPLNLEEMYNVFPFDNTITTMFLSGDETQEMFDFVAARSAERGCRTQAQVVGHLLRHGLRHRRSRLQRAPARRGCRTARAPRTSTSATAAACADGTFNGTDVQAARSVRRVSRRGQRLHRAAAARASRCSSATPPSSTPASRCATRWSTTSARCPTAADPSMYTNIIGVTCKDAQGETFDCTTTCCCPIDSDTCAAVRRVPRLGWHAPLRRVRDGTACDCTDAVLRTTTVGQRRCSPPATVPRRCRLHPRRSPVAGVVRLPRRPASTHRAGARRPHPGRSASAALHGDCCAVAWRSRSPAAAPSPTADGLELALDLLSRRHGSAAGAGRRQQATFNVPALDDQRQRRRRATSTSTCSSRSAASRPAPTPPAAPTTAARDPIETVHLTARRGDEPARCTLPQAFGVDLALDRRAELARHRRVADHLLPQPAHRRRADAARSDGGQRHLLLAVQRQVHHHRSRRRRAGSWW